ncbi:hypothetical protein [Dissulfurispira thermophila]
MHFIDIALGSIAEV